VKHSLWNSGRLTWRLGPFVWAWHHKVEAEVGGPPGGPGLRCTSGRAASRAAIMGAPLAPRRAGDSGHGPASSACPARPAPCLVGGRLATHRSRSFAALGERPSPVRCAGPHAVASSYDGIIEPSSELRLSLGARAVRVSDWQPTRGLSLPLESRVAIGRLGKWKLIARN
jgi:hypothetical protein